MKRRTLGIFKRIVSVSLAVALVTTSVQITVNPSTVEKVEAASTGSTMETKKNLDSTYVKDPEVLKFYKILANAQKMGKASELSGKTAGEILSTYTSSDYTGEVYGTYLTEFEGEIDFTGLTITNVSGIGWARAATKIDLSGATFTTTLTEVPADEFAACKKLQEIVLPQTVTKIGNNAFENCLALQTLRIGAGSAGVVDLTKVDEVGASAFSGCASISTVNFAPYGTRSVELKIGTHAFAACSSISELEIPIKTAANLGANAFENCEGLSRVGLQNELTYLNNSLFKGAGAAAAGRLHLYIIGKADETVSRLPENITYIGDNCFDGASLGVLDLRNCTKLTKLNQYAFAGTNFPIFDSGLNLIEALFLPESLEKIETLAFNSSGVVILHIPEKCSTIEADAFAKSALVKISLPKSLTEIKDGTFQDCEMLQGSGITIASGSLLETIGEKAFYECKSLGTTSFLKDLKKLTTIKDSAFANCYAFVKVNNSEQVNMYGDKRLRSGLKEVVLPDCVEALGASVFADNYALKTVDLGTGITAIPDRAFYNSKETSSKSGASLEKVIVSSELDSIGVEAFANQSRLHTIGYKDGNTTTVEEGVAQFNEGLLSIGNKAFAGCGIQSSFSAAAADVYVRKGAVKNAYTAGLSKFLIYDYDKMDAEDDYCYVGWLDEADITATADMAEEGDYDIITQTLTASGEEKYELVHLVAKEIYVDVNQMYDSPSLAKGEQTLELYDTYDTVTNGYEGRLYSNINGMEKAYCESNKIETVVSKEPVGGKEAVWTKIVTASNISNVAVPNAITKNYSMNYVFGLKDVIIPDTVINDNLGESAFEKCINLNEVKLSDNLTEIKNNTFSGAGLEVINFVNTDKKAKYYDYTGLRTITIPDGIKTIGDNAFANCYNLLLKTRGGSSFGTSVESIGNSAFSNCYTLDSVKFPTSLKTIGDNAFANCALQYEEPCKVKYENTNQEYSYYVNAPSYGTKETKKGLNEIDFTSATSLETVGTGAFKKTNVVTVNLTDSPLVQIPNNLFEQCSYLKTIVFQSKTASVGENVLKDVISLTTVSIPAKATVKKNTISGAFGSLAGAQVPTLNFTYNKEERIEVPIDSSVRLPINCINKDIVNGEVKISVDTGDGKYQDILGKEVNGIKAEFNQQDDPHSFILYGTEYVKEPVTVKVEMGTAFQYAASTSYMISSHTMEFQVTVDDVPTQEITLSAAEDSNVKANPAMYVENGTNKTLYIPLGGNASKNGVKLTANLLPLETTNGVTWSSDNEAITISNESYEPGSGVATALIKTTEIGYAEVTVTSGTKKDTIYVYSMIPVANGGLTCTTGGTYLDTNLKPNNANSPYGLSIGDTDKFVISLNYGNVDYTDEQKETYGEKYVFSSSDESVVSINDDGTFKALAEGNAVITVTAQASGTKLQFYFNVVDANSYVPSSITISGKDVVEDDKGTQTATINLGDTTQLSAKVAPSKASQEVTWKVTSGTDFISVDDKGVVTALKKGSGRVQAISKEKDSVKSKEVTITVLAPAKELKLLCGDVTLEIGNNLTLSKTTKETDTKGYFISPVDTTDTITWTSSNEEVVKITGSNAQSVTMKAIAAGTAELTGETTSGVKASIKITVPVKKVPVTGITVDKEVTLNVGATHQLNPQKLPADANEEVTYTYTTSNDKVATVEANGLIRAVGPGTAAITARTNTGKAAACTVIVKQPATKVTLMVNKPSFKKIYMAKGQTLQIKAKMSPDNTTDTLTYKSNKAKVAAVAANGVITAKKKGTAKITVTAGSGKKATITVVVSKKQLLAKKVKLKAPKTMKRKKTVRVTATLTSNKSTDTLSFVSNKPAVATVDAYGYVTALKKGKVKITVTASSGKKATKTIKVK